MMYGRDVEIPDGMAWLAGVHVEGHVAEIDDDAARTDAEKYLAGSFPFTDFQIYLSGPLNMGLEESDRVDDPLTRKFLFDAMAKIRSEGYEQAVRDVASLGLSDEEGMR